jgi:hypothetical protein
MSFSLVNFSSLEKSDIVKPGHKKKKSIKNISAAKLEELTAKDIVGSLREKFYTHKYIINNIFIYEWESDFFSISELDYAFEVEIKVTKGDFKDDFNKTQKHLLLESKNIDFCNKMPNKFFYAAPKNLLPSSIIPEYAGLIEVDPIDFSANIVKDAPYLHKEKSLFHLKDILLEKFYSKYKELLNES